MERVEPDTRHIQERRRADEMAALNRVARRISASLDLHETLDAIVSAAAELVPCVLAEISLWDGRSGMLTLQALRCTPERAFPIGETYPPGKGYTGWVVRYKQPLLVPDVDARQDIQPDLLPGELAFRAYIGLPLLAGDELIGMLVLIHDQARAFDAQDLELLEPLAGQAAIAIRNAQLFQETRRKARRLAALNAVASVINQPLSLQAIMDQAVAKVIEVMETEFAGIRLLDPATQELVVASYTGRLHEDAPQVHRLRLEQDVLDRLSQLDAPVVITDLSRAPQLANLAELARFRAFAIVPLRVKDKFAGILGVSTRRQHDFTPEDLELLAAIGHQLSVAIENARLAQEALDAERLAAVGRVASTVAHDLRSPLGGIIRSAEFLARPELSEATRQKLSGAIVAMARRLISTSQEILDFTRGGQMALRSVPCNLPDFLNGVLDVLRADFSDRGIEVLAEWGYTGDVCIDPDRMAQVVYNIAANARDAMSEGGRLTISTRQVGEWVELRFADTGPGVPPELVKRIFEPFVSYGKSEGAGLGLAIARRIVQEHKGEIDVECPAGGGAIFVVRLPLNQSPA